MIANCIIFNNAMILSKVLLYHLEKGDAIVATTLEKVSPVAWQHINFYGRYDFTKSIQPIGMEVIVQELVTRSSSARWTGW